MKKFKQAIHLEGRCINDVFKLPCVYSCHKEAEGGLCYLLYDWDDDGNYIEARIGDWLCEDEEGKWHVMSNEEYKEE